LIKAAPAEPAFRYNLGVCLFQINKPAEAALHLRRARQLGVTDPSLDTMLERSAAQLYAANRIDDALAILRDLAERRPNDTPFLLRLGDLLRDAGRFGEALEILGRVQASGADQAHIYNALGLVHQSIGALAVAQDHFVQALEIDPALSVTHKNLRYLTLNRPDVDAEAAFVLYCDLARRATPADLPPATFSEHDRTQDRRLRIGYVSSDFRIHVVGLNILPLIENHDATAVDLYFYSDVAVEDVVTQRFKACATAWRPIVDLPDGDVAALMRADGIDIAIYLAGSFDANRAQIAAHRAAPVQVSYHDCATSGFAEMDYILGDDYVTPSDSPERFTEDVVRLPVFYQYERRAVPASLPAPPCIAAGMVTFGSFNKPEKINADVIELWARVLAAVPNSRVLLKYFDFYRGPEARRRIVDGFAAHGIATDRLVFRTGYDVSGKHLALYDAIDIALDTFPFAGATTTFEALSHGVPVVTLWGDRFVSRYAGAIVSHAGFGEFACDDADAYVDIARTLAADPLRLTDLKHRLPTCVAESPLCDGPAYARSIEAACRTMWARYCAL
jgi:predicted O-linked N-acetylglucosamine transferase (SPINDLY family)